MREEPPIKVYCPRCRLLLQIVTSRDGSAMVEVAGFVINQGKIEVMCSGCGHIFHLHAQEESGNLTLKSRLRLKERLLARLKNIDDFYARYEAGDKEQAYELLKEQDPFQAKYGNARSAYIANKRVDRLTKIVCIAMVIIAIFTISYFCIT